MIKSFHNIQIRSYALSLIFGALLLVGFFIQPAVLDGSMSSINGGDFFGIESTLLSKLIQLFVIFIGAISMQRITNKHDIVYKKSTLTLFFYILLHALHPSLILFSTFSILSIIGVLVLNQVINMYQASDSTYMLFLNSILVGVGSWFFAPYSIFILLVFFAYNRFHPLKLNAIILGLLGFSFAWLITLTVSYVNPTALLGYKISIAPALPGNLHPKSIIVLSYTALLILISMFGLITNSQRNTVKIRRVIQIITLFVFTAIVLIVLYFGINGLILQLLIAPASILLSYFFSITKRFYKFRLIIFYLLILLILYNQYSQYLYI